MNKYIIKNCPAFNSYCNWCRDKQKPCKDITDCVLKRIVFFCKMDVGNRDNMFLVSRYALADLILDMLEIEEMDE